MAANRSAEFLSGATSRLARKLNQQVSRVRDPGAAFPSDVLSADDVGVEFFEHVGFPEEADSLAYEAVQQLLAVGMPDGRVKLIGRKGVEATLRAPSGTTGPTRFLGFLRHRGALLRVTADGDVQLFSVPGRRLLASVRVEGDAINDVAIIPGAPYILMGCESGDVRVVAVSSRGEGVSGGGSNGGDAEPAAGLSLQPYKILGEDVDGAGGVVAVAVARNGDRPLALIVHRKSGALVWDIRAERVVCSAADDEDEPSKPTCACWVGEHSNCFAVGYDDGSILVWGIPQLALRTETLAAPQEAVLLGSLRAAPDGSSAASVHSLSFLPGGPGTPGNEDCLLVRGGQALSDPEMLTLLPIDVDSGHQAKPLPWFGALKAHVVMPHGGSTKYHHYTNVYASPSPHKQHGNDATPGAYSSSSSSKMAGQETQAAVLSSVMVLTEGGQLVVHDVAQWQPNPVTLPLQELPPVTLSRMVPALSTAQAAQLQSTSVQHALTLDKLHSAYNKSNKSSTTHSSSSSDWPFNAGQPASINVTEISSTGCHPSALLFTGHRDGRVRVWDSVASVPTLLATVPSTEASAGERLRPISSMEICPASGLLAVGHIGGDVRMYQFADRPQAVRRASLDESLVPYDAMIAQPAGFQYVLRYDGTHTSDITALALDTKEGILIVGDAAGSVSAIDLAAPMRAWQGTPAAVSGTGIARLKIGTCDEGTTCVFVASTDCSLGMLSLRTGEALGSVKPKSVSRPLDLCLLDCHGVPLTPPMGTVVLPWADNNNVAALRPLRTTTPATKGRHSVGGEVGKYTPSLVTPLETSPLSPGRSTVEIQQLPSDEDEDDDDREEDDREDEDEDLDAALSAAAAEATAGSTRGVSRFNIFGRMRSPSPGKKSSGTTPAGSRNASTRVTPRVTPRQGSLTEGHRPGTGVVGNNENNADNVAGGTNAATHEESTSTTPPAGLYKDPSFGIDTTADLWNVGGSLGATPATAASNHRRPTPSPYGGCTTAATPAPGLSAPGDAAAPGFDYPHLEAALCSPPTNLEGGHDINAAAYVVISTATCLRVYSMESVRQGDRSTDRKAKLDPPAVFSSVFLAVAGPGVVSVSADGRLSVHSVPGLAPLVSSKALQDADALGFPWHICDTPSSLTTTESNTTTTTTISTNNHGSHLSLDASSHNEAARCCCSVDGQVLLMSAGNEMVRLTVVKDCAAPAAPASTFDWEVAKAAKNAAAGGGAGGGNRNGIAVTGRGTGAGASAGASSSFMTPGNAGLSIDIPSPPATAPTGNDNNNPTNLPTAGSTRKSGPSASFLAQVRGAATALAEGATTATGAMVQEIQGRVRAVGIGGSGGAATPPLPPRELPKLKALFSTYISSLEGEGDFLDLETLGSGDGQGSGDSTSQQQQDASGSRASGLRKLTAMLPVGRKTDEAAALAAAREAARDKRGESAAKGRRQLLGSTPSSAARTGGGGSTSKSGARAALHRRTASEVKRAYGYGRADDARSTMERNKAMLAERGEKLRQLEERAAMMAGDAEGFSDLAKQLEEAMSNRKWWQL